MSQIVAVETVTCPWCETQFEIIPTSSAKCFPCPGCKAESALPSLRNPDLRPAAWRIGAETSIAIKDALYQHSVPYVFLKQNGKVDHASGTVVEIEGHIFVATVAHARPRNLESIALVRKTKIIAPDGVRRVINHVASQNQDLDVAALEIDPRAVDELGVVPIGLDRISDNAAGMCDTKAFLMGYPADYCSPNAPVVGITGFFGLSYGTEVIHPDRWKVTGVSSSERDEQIHIIATFDSEIIDYGPDVAVPRGLPSPYGMSGGGFWQRRNLVADDEIWTPDAQQLFGIQSAWFRDKGFVRGVQIIHWLRLIAEQYPNLKVGLKERFLRLLQS